MMAASRSRLPALLLVAVCAWATGSLLLAAELSIPAESHNCDGAPIISRSSTARLIEQQGKSTTSTTVTARPVNRTLVSSSEGEGESSSRFVSSATVKRTTTAAATTEHRLKGEIKCWNKSAKTADALGVLVVPLDEDANALIGGRKSMARVDGPIRSGQEVALPWELSLKATEVAEVSVVILTIKFADGTIWQAPDVEMVDFF